MKRLTIFLLNLFIVVEVFSQLNVTAKLVRADSIRGRVDTLNMINLNQYAITVNDTLLQDYIAAKGGGGSGPSFGNVDEIPHMNIGGTDFDYNSIFTFNGTNLRVGDGATEWVDIYDNFIDLNDESGVPSEQVRTLIIPRSTGRGNSGTYYRTVFNATNNNESVKLISEIDPSDDSGTTPLIELQGWKGSLINTRPLVHIVNQTTRHSEWLPNGGWNFGYGDEYRFDISGNEHIFEGDGAGFTNGYMVFDFTGQSQLTFGMRSGLTTSGRFQVEGINDTGSNPVLVFDYSGATLANRDPYAFDLDGTAGGFEITMSKEGSLELGAPTGTTGIGDINVDGSYFVNGEDLFQSGTYTPVVSDGTTSATGTFNGSYTRTGNLVTARAECLNINTTGLTATAQLIIDDFPFNFNDGNWVGTVTVQEITFPASVVYYTFNSTDATNQGRLFGVIDGGSPDILQVQDLTSGSSDIIITITYQRE